MTEVRCCGQAASRCLLLPRFYPSILSLLSLTSTAASAASAALCAAVFLGLADAATERGAGCGEPTERRREKCDAATDDDDDSGGARCCCFDGAAEAAAAATARRGAPNELLLATPPRVATTVGCCIKTSEEREKRKGAYREMEPLERKIKRNPKEGKNASQQKMKTHSEQKKKRERKRIMRLSLACLAASAARTVSRRAQRGIYAGKDVRSGNKVSEDGGNR